MKQWAYRIGTLAAAIGVEVLSFTLAHGTAAHVISAVLVGLAAVGIKVPQVKD